MLLTSDLPWIWCGQIYLALSVLSSAYGQRSWMDQISLLDNKWSHKLLLNVGFFPGRFRYSRLRLLSVNQRPCKMIILGFLPSPPSRFSFSSSASCESFWPEARKCLSNSQNKDRWALLIFVGCWKFDSSINILISLPSFPLSWSFFFYLHSLVPKPCPINCFKCLLELPCPWVTHN